MSRNVWMVAGGMLLVVLVGFQVKVMGDLRKEVAVLRSEIRGVQSDGPVAVAEGPRTIVRPANISAGLQARLTHLERSVASLAKVSELLMDRGVVPPSEEHVAQIQQRFFDPTASDRDRLRSLQLLRRNRQMDDTVVAQAVNWLQSATNGNTRRGLLQQLDGITNAAMKQPLIAMLQTEQSGNVREELVDVLSEFADDPAVETKLWDLAMSDPDDDVREEARDTLADGEMSPERIEKFRNLATSPDAPLEQRLFSLRALQDADIQAPEVVSELASLAQNSTDPIMRARLFQAFDGMDDPSLMAPLVYGLQDPSPVVRENAVDALGSFSSDPRIQEWLNHVIQNDADPRVKREAQSALEQNQRQNQRRGGRDRGRDR